MRYLICIIIGLIIGLNMPVIKQEINRVNHVQYCNDIYMGRSEQIQACILNK